MSSPLLKIPTEILLCIIDQLSPLPRDRRTHLLTLTVVCKRLSSFAIALLLTNPYVEVNHTRRLVDNYLAHPDQAYEVRSLELYCNSEISAPTPKFASQEFTKRKRSAVPKNKRLWKSYTSIIRSTNLPQSLQNDWKMAIKHEDDRAWLGLLLVVLPNLTSLLLGGIVSEYFKRVDPLCVTAKARNWRNGCSHKKSIARQSYLRDVFIAISPRLQTLELPYLRLWKCWDLAWPMDLCAGLTHLVTHVYALCLGDSYVDLPPTLRTLSVACGEGGDAIGLLDCIAARMKDGKMPLLKEVEIYIQSRSMAVEDADLHNSFEQMKGREEMADLGIDMRYSTWPYWTHVTRILAKSSISTNHSKASDTNLRMLELRGALKYLEGEAKELEQVERAEKIEAQRRADETREERHRERRNRGEESDTDSEDIGFGCFI